VTSPARRSRRAPRGALGAAAASLALSVAAACASPAGTGAPGSDDAQRPSTSTSTAPSTSVAPTTTAPPSLAPVDPVAWAPCGGGLDCATVAVPVDHAAHAGPRIDLALVRRPAGDPGARIGVLLVNPGGPGASGTARVRRGFVVSDEVAARFDVVGFDPRGVGESAPFGCDAEVARFRAANLDPAGPAQHRELDEAARALAEACEASAGDLLAHLGTADVVRDVELIRRALGEARVSYVGLSYGTQVGLLWADTWPTSMRAMVLDAVVDPAAAGRTGSTEQVEAVDARIGEIDAACAADPGCPLLPTGGVLAAHDVLAETLAVEPVDGVGRTQLAYATIMATYDPELWPRLWDALASALDGEVSGLAALADRFTSLVEYAPYAAVTCLDADHPVGYRAWQRQGDALAAASARVGRVIANELLPCAHWPPATLEPRQVRITGGPPVLVVAADGDAATPLPQAARVTAALDRARLLTVRSDRHVSLSWNRCAQDAATRYLVDLELPPPDHRC
jgi:pimeloyl-ACP methyl ester carboxylesterase